MYETYTQQTVSYYTTVQRPTQVPPGPDPHANYGPYPVEYPAPAAVLPAQYSDPNVGSPAWVVRQSAPVIYSPAVQPLSNDAITSTGHGHDTSMNSRFVGPSLVGKQFKRKLKKPKVVPTQTNTIRGVRCNLCKIECPDVKNYEMHLSGKQHSKSLKKKLAVSTLSSQPSSIGVGTSTVGEPHMPGVPSVPTDLEAKKQKMVEGGTAVQSVRMCTICGVACTGEIAFADHIAGKKHASQERALGIRTNSNPNSASNTVNISGVDKTKITNPVGAFPCEVCKISCTDADGLIIHRQGKKHSKNLAKLRSSIPNLSTPAVTPAPMASVNPPVATIDVAGPTVEIGPQPKPVVQNDLATKKRKMMESGAAADDVRACSVCNVVCNSQAVFDTHLAGHKHASMVKQAAAKLALDNQFVTAAI